MKPGPRVRVILADDHPVVLLGVRGVLDAHIGIEVVAEASRSDEIVALLKTQHCDVLITDFSMPAGTYGEGLGFISYTRRHFPNVPIIVLTMIGNPAILQSILDLGVMGLLDKGSSINRLPDAISSAVEQRRWVSPAITALLGTGSTLRGHSGRRPTLSPREAEVFRLLASGMSLKQIAAHLNRSHKTISQQKNDGMRKLNLKTDMELLTYLREHGFTA